jgi:hypothetical protein
MDFTMSWVKPDPSDYQDGIQLPNNYKIEIATGTLPYSWHSYDCDIWGAMTNCNLSTTRLMQPPFNLKNGDPVLTRLYAVNDAGTSAPNECFDLATKIRTKPCVPMNFRRDYSNALDENNTVGNAAADQLCFIWDTCVEDNEVMYKLYK